MPDSEGSFTVKMGKESEGVVYANALGCVADYKILKNADDNIDLVLKKDGRTLGGTVVDADGKPAANALVAVAALTREVDSFTHEPWTVSVDGRRMSDFKADENGKFVLKGLPALPVVIWAADAGDTSTLDLKKWSAAKKQSVDLSGGDNLDYEFAVEVPVKRSPEEEANYNKRVKEHEDRIKGLIEKRRKVQNAAKNDGGVGTQ